MATNLEKLQIRFEAAGYNTDIITEEIMDEKISRLIFWDESVPEQRLTVSGKKWIDYISASEFDQFRPLDEFDAICNESKQLIECGLDSGYQILPISYRLESIARSLGVVVPRTTEQRDRDPDINIEIPSPREGVKITLCFCRALLHES